MSKRIKLVIFDLDGTLVEFPREYLLSEVNRIMPKIDLPQVSSEKLNEAFRSFNFFSFLEEENRQKLVEAYWDFFDWSNYPSSKTFSFSEAVLNGLNDQGFQCCIATARATSDSELEEDLRNTGLLPHLTLSAFRESKTQDWKDKLPQIQRVLDFHQVTASEAIMVGDTPPDIICAKQAGLAASVAVLSGGIYESVLQAAQPSFILDDVSSLPKVMEQLA